MSSDQNVDEPRISCPGPASTAASFASALKLAWQRCGVIARRLRKPLILIASAGTVLGGIAGYLNFYRSVRAPVVAVSSAPPSTEFGPGHAQPLSILVFPLTNLTGDPAKGYLAEGLTSAIVTGLGRIRGAVVVPPLAAVALRDEKLTVQQLGERGHVNYVVDGNLTAKDDRVRIVLQLASTQRGEALWSRVFDGSTTDVLAIQDSIIATIRGTVGPTLVVAESRETERRHRSPEAADLIIRAEAYKWRPRTLENEESRGQLCRQALKLEPENLAGLECLATSLSQKADWLRSLGKATAATIATVRAESDAAAHRALALDPSNVAAFNAIGSNANARNDFQTARNAYERMLAIDPDNSSGLNNFGALLRDIGELDRSYELLTRAAALPGYGDPIYPWTNLGATSLFMRRPDEAIAWYRKVLVSQPEHLPAQVGLALAYGAVGRTADAKQVAAEVLKHAPDFKLDLDDDPPWPGKEAQHRELIAYLRGTARSAGIPE